MVDRLIKFLLNIGVHGGLDLIEVRRYRLFNILLSLASVISMGLVVTNLVFGQYFQALAAIASILVIFIPSYFLISKNHYKTACLFFAIVTSLLISFISGFNLSLGNVVGTENILIGMAVSTVVLFDSDYRKRMYSFIIIQLITLVYLKVEWLDTYTIKDFFLSSINYSVSFILIYFTVDYFRKDFISSYEKIVQLNDQLTTAHLKVKSNQQVYFDMIDNLPLYLVMLDKNGNFTAMNAQYANALGHSVNNIIGKHYTEVFPEEILEHHWERIEDCIKGQGSDFTEEINFPNEESFEAYGSYVPIFDNENNVVSVANFITDITDIKEKEAELERLNDSKNRMFSVIAHDLRKPLNLLNGIVFMSKQGDLSELEKAQYFDQVDRQIRALREMMDNVLIWARNQMTGSPEMIRSHNLSEIIEEELLVYETLRESKNIEVTRSFEEDFIIISDDMFIRMLVRNIYTNALKFTPQNGTINISINEEEKGLRIAIKDSGIGMSKEVIDQIKSGQMVYSKEGTKGEKGSGIGLYLGLEMLRESGGDIEIKSEENKGTEFCIFVPVRLKKTKENA